METRIEYRKLGTQVTEALLALDSESSLEQSLLDLVKVRVSQINGCAVCLDMHVKDARASSETELRLYSLVVWRVTSFYSERERAALAWTEAVTLLNDTGVSDELYEKVRLYFDEQEITALTMAVIAINSWNRLFISLRPMIPGHYKSPRLPEGAAQAG